MEIEIGQRRGIWGEEASSGDERLTEDESFSSGFYFFDTCLIQPFRI
jgi:hypothetical protein